MTIDPTFPFEGGGGVAQRVLHLEPDETLAAHVATAIGRAGTPFEVVRVATREAGIRSLIDEPFEAALVNLDAPPSPGAKQVSDVAFLRDVVLHAPGTAIVACTTRPADELGSSCLRAGASTVIQVADLSTRVLERVLRFALDRKVYESSIRALATTDDLTGAGNRRALQSWHRAAANKLSRHGGQIVVGVIDIDDFKSVNDVHGHLAGDDVLRAIANRLAAAFRPDDAAVRLGGDEFAVVLHSLDRDARSTVAERVSDAVASPPLEAAGHVVRASSGFSATDDPDEPLAALLHAADEAMYVQKRRARS